MLGRKSAGILERMAPDARRLDLAVQFGQGRQMELLDGQPASKPSFNGKFATDMLPGQESSSLTMLRSAKCVARPVFAGFRRAPHSVYVQSEC